jgi:hypothetical protein
MCCFLGFNNYVSLSGVRNGIGVLIFKLEEEEGTALLLHLPKHYAETAVSGSAS